MVFVITIGSVICSIEYGYRWADRRQARRRNEVEAPIGAMVGASLGLLAFLLAVTFGIASEAIHDRRTAVVEEANAIRTTFLQASLIPEPQRQNIRGLLQEYTNERLRWAGVPVSTPSRSEDVLQSLLWQQTAMVGQNANNGEALFIESMNRTFDLQARREMLRFRSRIPGGYVFALLAISILAHMAMGYHGGVAGTARSPVMLLVAIAFSVVILLIFDLDRPEEGIVDVSQQSMIDVRNWMEGHLTNKDR
ncbi:MAG: hypothetical protein ER33_13365 [Cyanobium sp. CACIAM 14]|nr:MAG: hypothetical protein ER33_13365 [Cyanobium sp. CACIAM 14]